MMMNNVLRTTSRFALRSLPRVAAAAPTRSLHSSVVPGLWVKTLEEVASSGDVIYGKRGSWESRRYVTRQDGIGFSFHHTVLYKGKSTKIHYTNHVEAVIIIQGEGEIEVVEGDQQEGEGTVYALKPGTCYVLNQEKHFLRATGDGDMHVICAFNPPVAGAEDHTDDGVFPAITDEGEQIYDLRFEHFDKVFKPPLSLARRAADKAAAGAAPSERLETVLDDAVSAAQGEEAGPHEEVATSKKAEA